MENTRNGESRQSENLKKFVIRRGEVYTAEQVTHSFGIASKTLEAWVADGLRFGRRGTRSRYFLGDHLINFLFGE